MTSRPVTRSCWRSGTGAPSEVGEHSGSGERGLRLAYRKKTATHAASRRSRSARRRAAAAAPSKRQPPPPSTTLSRATGARPGNLLKRQLAGKQMAGRLLTRSVGATTRAAARPPCIARRVCAHRHLRVVERGVSRYLPWLHAVRRTALYCVPCNAHGRALRRGAARAQGRAKGGEGEGGGGGGVGGPPGGGWGGGEGGGGAKRWRSGTAATRRRGG